MRSAQSLLVVIAIIVLGTSCTTQRSRGELKGLKKLYDNTTAHYNGYFNANELLEASFVQLDQQHQDNYNQLLPIYPYVAATNPQAVSPGLDTAIKKVTVVVNLHRRSDWADDCYLLAGKAQYLKKDYESAESTFRFLINEFNPKEPKKNRGANTARASVAEKKEAAKEQAQEREKTAKEKKKEQERLRKERQKKIKQQKKEREQRNRQIKKARKKGKPAPTAKAYNTPRDSAATKNTPKIDTPKSKKKQQEEEDAKKLAEQKKREEEKEKEKLEDKNYFLKHRPAYQEGLFWLAKTLIERENFESAQRIITDLEKEEGTFDYIKTELPALQAYLNLKLQNREFAIQNLEEAVKVANKREEKARYAYVLAQLHQNVGNSAAAYTSFDNVLKFSNDYEMEFMARLNMAQNAWSSGRGSSEEAVANLEKMLTDDKNLEYKDRIYYALANIAMKNGDKAKVIENLKLSLQQSSQNQAQRIESYLMLAKLFYESEDFIAAKNYYDSTLQVLPQTDTRYAEVKRYSENLTDIAKNLEIIVLQDSLLRIANMTEEERKTFAAELKKRLQEEIEAALNTQLASNSQDKKGAAQRSGIASVGTAPVTSALQKESSFPLYDDRQLRQGRRDFQRKWGDRPLEDNWRRSSRQSTAIQEDTTQVAQEVAQVTEKEVEDLLKGVPTSESEKKIAQIKIQEALFKVGTLYRDRLENNKKAVAALEDLNNRFPGSSSELDSWYYLYLAYRDLGNEAKAQEYANKIIAKHPYSNYAKVIQDPSYIVEVQNEERKLSIYYEEAYAAFTAGNFQESYTRSIQSTEKFGATNPLRARFALLAAMSVGSLKGREEYISALNEVIAKYPNTPEQTYAKETLRLLGAAAGTIVGNQKVENEQFDVQNDQVHSIIVPLTDQSALNDAKNAVSDYNRKYHDLEKLRISDVVLVNGEVRTPMIVIRRFKDKADAMRYLQGVQKNSKDFINVTKYEIYPISQGNYGKLFSTVKSIETYKTFFNANYK